MSYTKRETSGVDIKKIRSIHSSYIITLPMQMLHDIGIHKDDNVIIFAKDNKLIIEKLDIPELQDPELRYKIDSVRTTHRNKTRSGAIHNTVSIKLKYTV